MRRRWGPVTGLGLLLVGSVLAVAVVLTAPGARAGQLPTQISPSTAPLTTAPQPTTPPSSSPATVPLTSPKTSVTTKPVTPTTAARVTVPPSNTFAPLTSPRQFTTRTTLPATTIPTTTTTIAGIGGKVPVAPVTLPLRTNGSNGHVDPLFAWLSGIGLAIALAFISARLFVTRPGGTDRAPLR